MPQPSAIVHEWWDRGEHDLLAARASLQAGGPSDSILALLQQAAEKYLKGCLLAKGWRLKRTHDLEELLEELVQYDASFQQFTNLADLLTGQYVRHRYPPGPPILHSPEETADVLRQAEEPIDKIKQSV